MATIFPDGRIQKVGGVTMLIRPAATAALLECAPGCAPCRDFLKCDQGSPLGPGGMTGKGK